MAKIENNGEGTSTPQYFTIEELRDTKKTPGAVFSGVCAAQGWKKGRSVTEEEYNKAVAAFQGGQGGRSGK